MQTPNAMMDANISDAKSYVQFIRRVTGEVTEWPSGHNLSSSLLFYTHLTS
jgi:hypothetical protein